jgi:hypothetical protein
MDQPQLSKRTLVLKFCLGGMCHNDFANMKGETPQQQWERLQREYQKAVQTSYPNAERHGCPGPEVLQDLAARSARHVEIDSDQDWKHVIHCAPCYREYLDLRAACRLREHSRPVAHDGQSS